MAGALAVALVSVRASAQSAPPPMQAGGLAPPPPGSGPPPPPPPVPNMTQRNLEQAADEDSGRGLEFVYFEAGGGAELISLEAFKASGYAMPDQTFGPMVNVGSGLRLLYLTLGPRFRFTHFGDWDLWTLNLDVGWRVPLGRLEPYAFVGGGFAKLAYSGSIPDKVTSAVPTPPFSGAGFDVRLGGGADYYVTNVFSVGASLSVELIGLWRGGDARIANASGSTLGLGVSGGALVGFHF